MSVGEALAEARHQAGLSVAQVSQRTRIREAIIHGIENDDYSACGGDFYARGHIRGIAKVTGVDPESLIREYDTAHQAPQTLTLADIFPDTPAAPVTTGGRRQLSRIMALAVLAALLMALGFIASGLLSGARHAAAAAPRARAYPVTSPRLGPDRRADAAVPPRQPARPPTLTPARAAAAGPPGGHGSTPQARPVGDRPRSVTRARRLVHRRPPQEARGGHRPAPELGPSRGDRRHADHARIPTAHRNRAHPGRHAAHRVRGPRGPRGAAAV